jgi:hypothetical protein
MARSVMRDLVGKVVPGFRYRSIWATLAFHYLADTVTVVSCDRYREVLVLLTNGALYIWIV